MCVFHYRDYKDTEQRYDVSLTDDIIPFDVLDSAPQEVNTTNHPGRDAHSLSTEVTQKNKKYAESRAWSASHRGTGGRKKKSHCAYSEKYTT